MRTDVEARQVVEGSSIGSYHDATRGGRRRRDQQIMRAARPSLAADLDEQSCMRLGHRHVIGDHRYRGKDVVHEGSSRGRRLAARQQ
jgi:hypothetical protein